MKKSLLLFFALLVFGLLFVPGLFSTAQMQVVPGVIEAGLREQIVANGQGQYLVYLKEQADLSAAYGISDWTTRGQYVYQTLWDMATKSQVGLVTYLNSQQTAGDVVAYRSFYIVNAVMVTSGVETLDSLATRPDIAKIEASKTFSIPEPIILEAPLAPQAIEWGVTKIGAPQVWSTYGTTGEGVVVANIDTGVQYNHPAVVNQYRGTTTGNHNYNWFDPAGICSPGVPCDNNGHGTHTIGTMVGDDGGSNQIGVAPGAQWIAAKGCESNSCSDSSLLASAQWILAPYPIGGTPAQGDASKRPNVVNNSWGGGGGDTWYQASVVAWRAAGIFPAFSAGNSGPGAGTVGSPGDYAESFASGATDISDIIGSFSSRGPSSLTAETKPDVSAPGVNVRSSVPTNSYANFNGTSMASPHTAGCVALLLSISPSLTITQIENLLTSTSVDLGTAGPDTIYGYGRINCFAAASQLAPDYTLGVSPDSVNICTPTNGLFTVNIGSIAGYSDPVTLNASGNPAGTTANFSPNPVTPAGSSTLTIGNTGVAPAGSYTINVSGSSTSGSHSDSVTLNVSTTSPGTPTLTAPANGASGTSLTPTFTWNAVSGATSYDLQVATDSGFTNIVINATGLTNTNYTPGTSLNPNSSYYWRTRANNGCGSGSYATPFSFSTAAVYCLSPAVAIPDNNGSGVNSTMNIGVSGTLTDLNVYVNANHTWVGDLRFSLTHQETGTVVTFFDRPGVPASTFGCSGNDIDTTLDDEAGTPVENQCAGSSPTINGTFSPNNPLSAFDGQTLAGTWILNAADLVGSDTGTLNQWCIVPTLSGGATATPTSVPPTATPTSVPPTATSTSVPPTATSTTVAATPTPTRTPRNQPTATSTPAGATATATSPAPTPTATAGNDLIFANGFESGNLSAWTSNSNGGGDLSVSGAAALVGTFGMQATINDTSKLYVQDDNPNAESRYRARFYFDPNSITMANGNVHTIFVGYDGLSKAVLQVDLRYSAGSYQLRAGLRSDSNTWTRSSWTPLSDSSHFVEVDWQAATNAGANNGSLTFWIDGSQQANLTSIDNDTYHIDRVRLGAVNGLDAGTNGIYYFDAFESRRLNYIGP